MKRFLIFAFCAVCALSLMGCGVNSKYVNRVIALEEGVSSPTSIEELKAAISKYEKRVEDVIAAQAQIGIWYIILGTRYLDKQMYGEALKTFEKAIEYYPANQNLFYYVAVCAGYMANAALDYNATGSETERDRYLALAESAYLRAISLEPRYARALYGLGVLYTFEMNEPAKAIPYLETLLTIETKQTDGMFVLARAYYMTGEYEKAVEMYDRIISVTTSPEKKSQAEENKKTVLGMLYG